MSQSQSPSLSQLWPKHLRKPMRRFERMMRAGPFAGFVLGLADPRHRQFYTGSYSIEPLRPVCIHLVHVMTAAAADMTSRAAAPKPAAVAAELQALPEAPAPGRAPPGQPFNPTAAAISDRPWRQPGSGYAEPTHPFLDYVTDLVEQRQLDGFVLLLIDGDNGEVWMASCAAPHASARLRWLGDVVHEAAGTAFRTAALDPAPAGATLH